MGGKQDIIYIHTQTSETIYAIASTTRMISQALFGDAPFPADPPSWLQLHIGTGDLPDAYRGLPVCPEHLRFSIVAVYVPDLGWRFTTLRGLVYGFGISSGSLQSLPAPCAIPRRCLLGCAAAYFDDEHSVEFLKDANVTQRGLQLVFTLMGAPPQPAKSFNPILATGTTSTPRSIPVTPSP